MLCTGFIWIRTETSGERQRTIIRNILSYQQRSVISFCLRIHELGNILVPISKGNIFFEVFLEIFYPQSSFLPCNIFSPFCSSLV
jgi:proline racemase